VLGLDGQGGVERFADYSQWDVWQAARKQLKPKAMAQVVARPVAAKRKLSYLDGREYAGIEQRIADAEQALEAKRAALQEAGVAKDGRLLEQTYREIEVSQKEVDALYARWAELEEMVAGWEPPPDD